jgi:hypothetical protein
MDKTITYDCGLFWEPLADGYFDQVNFDIIDKLARGQDWTLIASIGHASVDYSESEKSIRCFIPEIASCLDIDKNAIVICKSGNVSLEFVNA